MLRLQAALLLVEKKPVRDRPWYALPPLDRNETVEQWYFSLVWGIGNLLGELAHLGGLIYTLTQARMELTMELADVQPHVCNPDSKDLGSITGILQVIGLGSGSAVSLGWIVASFFVLSLSFHFVATGVLLSDGLGWFPNNRFYRMYKYGLYHNLAVWRWIEYFFSASIMLIIISASLGVRELRSVIAQVGCMAITILFGWFTDLYAHTKIECKLTTWRGFTFLRRWKPGSWKTRLQFHLAGYIPYALTWTLVFIGYRNAMDAFGQWMPGFVDPIVFGTVTVFSLFGFVQLALQLIPVGPSLYAWGELVYIALSFLAKAWMGIIIVRHALVDGAQYDRLLFHRFNPDKTTCEDFGY